MQHGVFLFGCVEMDDAGAGPPAPTDRRYTQKQMWHAATRMLDMGVRAEELGFDTFWLTEHHFQHEGYEVIPNGVLFGAVLAERTSRIKIGALFHIVPQWHPLRFAEDFSTMHNLSGGRGVLGVGRGTVPREAQPLGTKVGSFDNPDKAEADRINREMMDEAMDVILAAMENESFSYHGSHWDLPPPGIPDRGGQVEQLTLVPRPLYPFEIWQAITSPPTLEHVPGPRLRRRVLVAAPRVRPQPLGALRRDLREAPRHCARARARSVSSCSTSASRTPTSRRGQRARMGHDEFWKFLGPYGWSKGYMGADGKPAPPG